MSMIRSPKLINGVTGVVVENVFYKTSDRTQLVSFVRSVNKDDSSGLN